MLEDTRTPQFSAPGGDSSFGTRCFPSGLYRGQGQSIPRNSCLERGNRNSESTEISTLSKHPSSQEGDYHDSGSGPITEAGAVCSFPRGGFPHLQHQSEEANKGSRETYGPLIASLLHVGMDGCLTGVWLGDSSGFAKSTGCSSLKQGWECLSSTERPRLPSTHSQGTERWWCPGRHMFWEGNGMEKDP